MRRATATEHGTRIFQQVLCSGGCGLVFGGVAGSVYPVSGTIYGAFAGAVTGLACSVVVVPLVYTRESKAAWSRMCYPPLALCVVCMVVGLVSLVFGNSWTGNSSHLGAWLFLVCVYGSFFGSLVLYIGAAIWCRLRLPRAWPPLPEGCCEACGYSLEGLGGGICPECGADRTDDQDGVSSHSSSPRPLPSGRGS